MFLLSLDGYVSEKGTAQGWDEYLTDLQITEAGSCSIKWDTDKVIILQIFRGPTEAGHWTTLIVDRTRKDNPLAVFADSLPSYDPETWKVLQRLLQHTPLVSTELTWIRAEIPKQGIGTQDCGVFSSCFPTLYVRGLDGLGLLTTTADVTPPTSNTPIRSVKLSVPMNDASSWGADARKRMVRSLRDGKIKMEGSRSSRFYSAKVIWE